MSRLLLLLLVGLVPVASAQRRPALLEPTSSDAARATADLEAADRLQAERPPRYAVDPATGRPTLIAEARAEAERLAAPRRAAALARLAGQPRQLRPAGTPRPPEGRGAVVVFTVESTYDDPDVNPGNGVCSTSFGDCTLRAAIQEAVARPDTEPIRIEFEITFGPGYDSATNSWTITPSTPLPFVDQPDVTITGLTQNGASCGNLASGTTHDLNVAIDGSLVTGNGLDSVTRGFAVRGLVIRDFAFGYGITATGPSPLIECNYVGTNVTGEVAAGNADGIRVNGTARNNLVSGNAGEGIVPLPSFATITGNFVGSDDDGDEPLGNGANGILVVGATGTVLRDNLVSANGLSGIRLEATFEDVIEGNTIGTDPSATIDLGNEIVGIHCHSATNTRIGGTAAGQGNVLVLNHGDGVFVRHTENDGSSQRVAILRNEIRANQGLGIDLTPNGVNLNDPDDTDDGANQRTNFPVLTRAANDGTDATIGFILDALANTTYRVELFTTSTGGDPSGYGEGHTFRVATNATTDAAGLATLTLTRPAAEFPVGDRVTSTATPVDGSQPTGFRGTSEFSRAVIIEEQTGPPLTVTITPTGPPPPVVVARGERAFFDITFEVSADGPSSFQYWTEAVLPNGSVRGPLIGPNTVMVTPPATVSFSFSQRVPLNAPLGNYTYRVEAGTFPNTVLDEDSFEATVTAFGELAGREAGEGESDAWLAYDAAGRLTEPGAVHDLRTATAEAPAAASLVTDGLPSAYALHPAQPNPFADETALRYDLPETGPVRLVVYDVLGREVARLVDREVEAGRHVAALDGSRLPAGTYLARLEAGGTVRTQRLTLVR